MIARSLRQVHPRTSSRQRGAKKRPLLDAARSNEPPAHAIATFGSTPVFSAILFWESTAARARTRSIISWGILLATHGFAHRIARIRCSSAPLRRLRHSSHRASPQPLRVPWTRDLRNNVKRRVLTTSSTKSEESKIARSRRPAPPGHRSWKSELLLGRFSCCPSLPQSLGARRWCGLLFLSMPRELNYACQNNTVHARSGFCGNTARDPHTVTLLNNSKGSDCQWS